MKIYQPRTPAIVAKLLNKTGSTSTGTKKMSSKAIGLAVDLGLHSPSIGNLIKQEALAVGADAAVHKKTSRCEVPKTKIVLVGTLKQLEQLALKLQQNVASLPQIGKELALNLRKKFPG